MIVKASASLPDEDALEAVELFPAYEIDHDYKKDDRFRYGGELFKVLQDHTSQEDWKPDETPSLYERIAEPGDGDTPTKPIAYSSGMALIRDKYYSQYDVVYHCIRGSGIAVYADLSALVGNYVEVYEP
jgi:hypothetical protein